MSRFFDEDGNEVDPYATDEPVQDEQPNWRRQLERRIEKAGEKVSDAEARATKAEKQLAFAQAGIPLDHPMTPYFVDGYKGDMTAEAIKAEATKLNLVTVPEPVDQIPAEERAAHERMAASNAGAAAPGGRDFDAEMRAAKSPKEIADIYQAKGGKVVDD